MNITDGEKLILIMLSELYDKVGVDGEIDPDFIRSAISSDNTWSIPWKYTEIPFQTEETPYFSRKVLDILDMWSMIERSYIGKSQRNKELIAKEAKLSSTELVFTGFDGNNESGYLNAALFIINDLGRFEEFKGRDLNSHRPSVGIYERMLSVYKPIFAELNFKPLSPQNIIDILNERIHPDNR